MSEHIQFISREMIVQVGIYYFGEKFFRLQYDKFYLFSVFACHPTSHASPSWCVERDSNK